MEINGTLVNYYIHCKRQCYLCGNRINLEDNSELVKIGRAIHEEKNVSKNSEVSIDNIKVDKLTSEYLIELKKSDADIEAARWQTLYYLKKLKDKGIIREGKIEFAEKNKIDKKVIYVELTNELEKELEHMENEIVKLLVDGEIPSVVKKPSCQKCSYYEYCYL